MDTNNYLVRYYDLRYFKLASVLRLVMQSGEGPSMANIRIDPDTMNQRAGEYRQAAGEVGAVISRMDGLLSQLQAEWEGEASKAYADRYYSDLKPSFQKAQQLIEEIAAALDKNATAMREQDAAQAAGWR